MRHGWLLGRTRGGRAGRRARTVRMLLVAVAVAIAAAGVVAGASARSARSPGRMVLPATLSRGALATPGLRVVLRLRHSARRVGLVLRSPAGASVTARTFRVRGRNLALRLRVSAGVAGTLPGGRYTVLARVSPRGRRLSGALAVTVPAPAPPAIVPPSTVPTPPPPPVTPPPPPANDPVIAAAGDIACMHTSPGADPSTCQQAATAKLITDVIKPVAVLGAGDFQYDSNQPLVGTLQDYSLYYDPYWGKFKSITYPINAFAHDGWGQPSGGWYQYFSAARPDLHLGGPGYSFNLGSWHIVALNAACGNTQAGAPTCDPNTVTQWLQGDLSAHPSQCLLAFLHVPLYSSPTASHPTLETYVRPWYQLLYQYGAEAVISGENHDYERFAPQDPNTNTRDDAKGFVQFVVGTGGESHYKFSSTTPPANSVVRDDTTFGVLQMTLHASSYDYRFVPVPGGGFAGDQGTGQCH